MSEGMATILAFVLVLVFIVIPAVVLYIYVDRKNTKTINDYWKKFTDEFEQALEGKSLPKKFIESVLSAAPTPIAPEVEE